MLLEQDRLRVAHFNPGLHCLQLSGLCCAVGLHRPLVQGKLLVQPRGSQVDCDCHEIPWPSSSFYRISGGSFGAYTSGCRESGIGALCFSRRHSSFFGTSTGIRSCGFESAAFIYGCTAVARRVRLGNLEAQPLKSNFVGLVVNYALTTAITISPAFSDLNFTTD